MADVAAEQLVVDASVALAALLSGDRGFAAFVGHRLVAPPLLWPEARSALHQLSWRGDLPSEEVTSAHARLSGCPIRARNPDGLGPAAWAIADRYGWAKTYDAEYVALAELLGSRMITLDRRLRDRVADPTMVIGPTELADTL